MKALFLSFIITVTFATSVHAKECTKDQVQETLTGLKTLSLDITQSEEIQEEANFAYSLINADKENMVCDFKSGFLGSVYDIETSTHKIHISFATKTITNLILERLSFNK